MNVLFNFGLGYMLGFIMKKKRFWLTKGITLDILLATVFLFLAVGVLAMITFSVTFFNPISKVLSDFEITDLLYSRLNAQQGKVDTNIILVNIGQLDRAGIAREVETIRKYSPKVMGFDGFFSVRRDSVSDLNLRNQFFGNGNSQDRVVMGCYLTGSNELAGEFDELERSHPYFDNQRIAFINLGGSNTKISTVRTFNPVEVFRKDTLLAMSAELARAYSNEAFDKLYNRRNETEIINYVGNTNAFTCFDPDEVFDTLTDLSVVKDKIVLFGYIGPSWKGPHDLEDIYFTPMNEELTGRSLPDMYGMVIHANATSMILSGTYINTMPMWLTICSAFIVTFFYILLLTWYHSKQSWHYNMIFPAFLVFLNVFLIYLFFLIYSHFNYNIRSTSFLAPILLYPTFKTYYERVLIIINKRFRIKSVFLSND